MRELGWVEGETLIIDYAYGEGRPERMLELAVALANGPAQLVIASGSDAVVAARSAITQKPVVAVSTGAALGVGESLARRAGNLPGSLCFSIRPLPSGSRCFLSCCRARAV